MNKNFYLIVIMFFLVISSVSYVDAYRFLFLRQTIYENITGNFTGNYSSNFSDDISDYYLRADSSNNTGFIGFKGNTRTAGYFFGHGTSAMPNSIAYNLKYDGNLYATRIHGWSRVCIGNTCLSEWSNANPSHGERLNIQLSTGNKLFTSSNNFKYDYESNYLNINYMVNESTDEPYADAYFIGGDNNFYHKNGMFFINDDYDTYDAGYSTYEPSLFITGDVIVNEGRVYASGFEGLSPLAFLNEVDIGYTRICLMATDGVIVMEFIEFNELTNKYEKVYVPNHPDCFKILERKYKEKEYLIVNGVPSVVVNEYIVFTDMWSRDSDEELFNQVIIDILNYVVNKTYYVGDLFKYPANSNVVYEVLQNHVSQSDWLPNNVPALYKVKQFFEYNEVLPWIQPTGSHDCYPLNALVTYQSQTWKNTGSNCNVWAPGVYGWVVV